MMFDLIMSAYNGIFMICFLFTNLFIFYHFMNKLCNVLFHDEDKKTGYILVTGCDTGFGYKAALEFNKRHLHVFAGCLTEEGAQRLIEDDSFKGTAFIMDITKKKDINDARNIIEEKVGDDGLWCLINNAGLFTPGPIEWMSLEDMKHSMDVNLWGAVNVTKIMLPLLKRARGRIVTTTSVCGRVSARNLASYCMSKYALEAYSDSLRYEMKEWGVSVHIIEPGIHGTNLYDGVQKRWQGLWDIQPEEIKVGYGEEFYKESSTVTNKIMATFLSDPHGVVNAYLHAALSSRPKLRYLVGMDANTFFLLLATLPTAVGDAIVEIVDHLVTKKAIPAAMKNTN